MDPRATHVCTVVSVHDLGDAEVHQCCDGCDGLVLCQVEGTHHEVASLVVGLQTKVSGIQGQSKGLSCAQPGQNEP